MCPSEGAFRTVTCGQLIDIRGNRLSSITDNGRTNYKEGSFDHKGSKSNYSYDTCGSLTSDTGKGINRIEYDVNGMPSFIKFTNGNETEYVYTSDVVKLKTIIHRTDRIFTFALRNFREGCTYL